jgi:hypothetical protein
MIRNVFKPLSIVIENDPRDLEQPEDSSQHLRLLKELLATNPTQALLTDATDALRRCY